MSLAQRMDEGLAQIMTPEEFRLYRELEEIERQDAIKLWQVRYKMRKMRAKARKRQADAAG